MQLQARSWYKQCRFEDAKSGALRAGDVYESLRAARDLEHCSALLRDIEEGIGEPVTPGKFPETLPLSLC